MITFDLLVAAVDVAFVAAFTFGGLNTIIGKLSVLENWYQCTYAPYVPLDDFNLFKNILKLKNKELLKVCLKTFNDHKSYVDHKLIAFSLFDPRINNDQKQTFVNNINKKEDHLVV